MKRILIFLIVIVFFAIEITDFGDVDIVSNKFVTLSDSVRGGKLWLIVYNY